MNIHINTKFNIGDKVWMSYFGKTMMMEIKDIRIESNMFGNFEVYYNFLHFTAYRPETDLFATEEELIDNFTDDIYVSSQKCYKSEFKSYWRKKKLNKILNETKI